MVGIQRIKSGRLRTQGYHGMCFKFEQECIKMFTENLKFHSFGKVYKVNPCISSRLPELKI